MLRRRIGQLSRGRGLPACGEPRVCVCRCGRDARTPLGELCGPSNRTVPRRQFEVFDGGRFARLARPSNGHLYNLHLPVQAHRVRQDAGHLGGHRQTAQAPARQTPGREPRPHFAPDSAPAPRHARLSSCRTDTGDPLTSASVWLFVYPRRGFPSRRLSRSAASNSAARRASFSRNRVIWCIVHLACCRRLGGEQTLGRFGNGYVLLLAPRSAVPPLDGQRRARCETRTPPVDRKARRASRIVLPDQKTPVAPSSSPNPPRHATR